MSPSVRKSVYAAIAGLSLAGTVAGCAPTANEPSAPDGVSTGGSGTPGASSAPPSGTYKDGTYSADGNYVSPNGTETVGVQLTLASGAVTDVKITEHPSNPNTRKFQGEFSGGIADQVVGKNVDDLKISKVAGSSLTSGGFNQALERIKSQAR